MIVDMKNKDPLTERVLQDAERYRKLRNLGVTIPIGFTGRWTNSMHTYRNTMLDSVVDVMRNEREW